MLLLEIERLEPKPPKPLNREFIKSIQCSENDNGGGNWGGERVANKERAQSDLGSWVWVVVVG